MSEDLNNSELPKAYEPQKVEDNIYKLWEESGFFNPDNLPGKRKDSYIISMPPPNATGELHLGHAVMLAIEDIFIRHARMRGKAALWLPGTDHAAIATESVVIKKLQKEENIRDPRIELGRDELVNKIAEFVENSRGTIRNQIKKMGASCDWSRERYTLEPTLSRCVTEVFKKMYEDELIYRGNRIINWDPKLQTTISDDEIEWQEEKTPFYYLKYGPFTVGTARPETKFGDKYVVMHPADARYKKYKHGQGLEVDWINGKITATIVKDEAVDPEFGSGVMTITPWHDRTDFEIAERHNLDKEQIIGYDGRLLVIAGEFSGLKIQAAREKILAKLESQGLLEKIDESYVHNIALSYRSKGPIEPQIKEQWFVDVNKQVVKWKHKKMSLKEIMQDVVRSGDIKTVPKHFEKIYFHWIDNLRDWCISRQIWWGHRIPVWYKTTNDKLLTTNKKNKIGFHERTVGNVLSGAKTRTYRMKDYGLRVGDVLNAENSQSSEIFGQVKITYLETKKIKDIELGDPKHVDNYKTTKDLVEAINFHYPDYKIYDETEVYIYDYKLIKSEPEIYVGNEPPKDDGPSSAKASEDRWTQDPDTLDTWFSSGLWTWSTLIDPRVAADNSLTLKDLLKKSPDFQKFHPTQILETGYDILFFWVARMILSTTYATGQIPFETVYLHGLVRDRKGQKMSKSKPETMVDPLDMIGKYGADALRLSMVVGQTPGSDQRLFEEKIKGYRNFVNKIWNIARFILMNLEEDPSGPIRRRTTSPSKGEDTTYPHLTKGGQGGVKPKTLADHWILSRITSVIEETEANIKNYRLSQAIENLYDFTWRELADWYLEIAKFEEDKQNILVYILENLLKLFHPFIPYVTEHIWSLLQQQTTDDRRQTTENLLLIQGWPEPEEKFKNKSVESEFQYLCNLIIKIRNWKSEQKIPIKDIKSINIDGQLDDEKKTLVEKLASVKISLKGEKIV